MTFKSEELSLYLGCCLESMKTMADNSVDSIVTDPPYGLSFMGKAWDYDVPRVEIWREALRVLKPGGHLLAFAGTRTQHRMAVNIEDAGFEIRDMISWVYGSGFPKSHNISKAIDKLDATGARMERRYKFTEWFVQACPLSKPEINDATNTADMARHLTDVRPTGKQPSIPTREHFEMLRPHLVGDVPQWVEDLVNERTIESENFKKRKVTGTKTGVNTKLSSIACPIAAQGVDKTTSHEYNETAPATPDAVKWDGWGTAIKPAVEPITVARKPFKGTVAANILKHGTGGVNIDACRNAERFPANFIHDGSPEVVQHFPGIGDKSAARFFYVPKTSKADRDEGLEGFADKEAGIKNASGRGFSESDPMKKIIRKNAHPTVKPTDLMRYLCRLVTPSGGVVLDPFMGSGSTGKAAALEGFRFVGCELSPEYFAIAEARIFAAHL